MILKANITQIVISADHYEKQTMKDSEKVQIMKKFTKC